MTTFWLSQSALATESLRPTLTRLATAVSKVLAGSNMSSVSIGQFSGPPSFASASGPGIRSILEEEFAKLGVKVKRLGAPVGVQGKYFIQSAAAGDQQQLSIQAEIVDGNGQVFSTLNGSVTVGENNEIGLPAEQVNFSNGKTQVVHETTDAGDIADTLGATIDIHAAEQRGQIGSAGSVTESFSRPTAFVENGNAVRASQRSPFSVQILVNGTPQAIQLVDGHPFVDLQKGESFHVRLNNHARFDIVSRFLLDGISSFAFSDMKHTTGHRKGEPQFIRWIIEAGKSMTLNGWHKDNQSVDEFKVTGFDESAAARLGSPTGVGTISVSVRSSWLKSAQPPEDEMQVAFAKAQTAIGFGRRMEQQAEVSRDPREYGRTRAVITIRYQK